MSFSTGSPSQKTQSKKVESKKPFFDCVRKPGLGFSQKRAFSNDKFDCVRNGLKTQKFAHFSLLSLSLHPCSRRGAERIRQGEGRWSRPPKTAHERSDLTEKFQSRESHTTEAETKKTPDQIPVP